MFIRLRRRVVSLETRSALSVVRSRRKGVASLISSVMLAALPVLVGTLIYHSNRSPQIMQC
jgi:hypothetical protein